MAENTTERTSPPMMPAHARAFVGFWMLQKACDDLLAALDSSEEEGADWFRHNVAGWQWTANNALAHLESNPAWWSEQRGVVERAHADPSRTPAGPR